MKKKMAALIFCAALAAAVLAVSGLTMAAAGRPAETAVSGGYQSGETENGSWTYDPASKTLTVSGKGEITQSMLQRCAGEIGTADTAVFSDGITAVEPCAALAVRKVVLGKDVRSCQLLAEEEYEVSDKNRSLAVYDGALYTKDFKELLHMPAGHEAIRYPEQLRIIGKYAYTGRHADILIIPWGVTTIREPGSGESLSAEYVLFPNTVTEFEINYGYRCPGGYYFWEGENDVLEEAAKVYNGSERDLTYAVNGFWERIGYRRISDICKGAEGEKIVGLYNLGLYKFCFGGDGKPVTGWQQIDGKWYCFMQDCGIAYTGLCTIDESYTDKLENELTYCFDEDGAMLTGTDYTEPYFGRKYRIDAMGVAAEIVPDSPESSNGFITENGNTRYYKDGQYVIGYQVIDGKRYVFDDNGVMQHSKWVQIYNVWHYLNDNGAAVVNCWRLKDGKYVYLGEYGGMKTSCWIKDYGYWYYVKADGSRYESSWAKINGVWYWFGGSGRMAQSRWLKLGGKWYYFTGSGAMAANRWVKSGAYWYYLGSSGAMLTSTTTPDGYRVDAQGRWVQ